MAAPVLRKACIVPTLLLGPRGHPARWALERGLVPGPRAPDGEVPAAMGAGSGTTSAHSDAEATVESVAPVIIPDIVTRQSLVVDEKMAVSSVFVFCGCSNKLPHTWWLTTAEIYSSQSWRPEIQNRFH